MPKTKIEIGFARYREEDFERLLEVSIDRSSMDPTYEEWRLNAERAIENFRAVGQKIRRVQIDPDEFLKWCNEQPCAPDGGARSQYATHLLATRHTRRQR